MFKTIRKNQKKFMALFGVVLMVMFIKGLVPDTGPSRPSARIVGTLAGTKITQTQLNNVTEEWQFLRRLYVVDPNHPEAEPQSLVVNRLGPELVSRINQSLSSSQNTPLFFLLIQEAIREGIDIRAEELQTFLTSYVRPLPEAGTDERESVEQAVSHCLMIRRMIDRADSVIKITRPLQQLSLARNAQDLSVKFVPVIAASFLDQVPAPTDADIRNQFDQYSDKIAAQVGRIPSQFGQQSDPLGFGYKVPNRVLVQYIGLSHSDVHDAAVASRTKEDWYVAAYGEFKSNRGDYDSRALPPTTQPAERLGPSTQPTPSHQLEAAPRKVENLDDDFVLHADLVLDDLYNREAQKLQDTILKQISEKMSSGFGSYRDAIAAAGPAAGTTRGAKPATGPAAEYVSFKFMQDLAASIRLQYGLTPILGNIQQLKTEEQLAQIPGIGRAVRPIAGGNQMIPFAQYATELFQPLMSEATKNSSVEALALVPWQPSNPLEDETRNIYVFRISGSDPAHTPPLADVNQQVIADWKINAAYEKALEASHLLLSSAQRQGLDAAAAEAHRSSPVVTDPFNPAAVLNGNAPPTITPLNLTPDSARELAGAALQLLTTAPGASNRPQLLAELHADRIIPVIELYEAKPVWDSEDKSLITMSLMERLRQEQRVPLDAQLCTLQAVSDRVGYQPESSSKTSQSP
ncbi:MAG: hypothetical protein ABSB74_15935 [Tepidisphaeraceae bacterium]